MPLAFTQEDFLVLNVRNPKELNPTLWVSNDAEFTVTYFYCPKQLTCSTQHLTRMKGPTDHICGYMQSKSRIKDTLSRYTIVPIQYSHHSQALQSTLTQHVSLFLFHCI